MKTGSLNRYIESLFFFAGIKFGENVWPMKEEKNMRTWYQETAEDSLKAFHVTKDGHTSEEAAELLESMGENVLEAGRKKVRFRCFYLSLRTCWLLF